MLCPIHVFRAPDPDAKGELDGVDCDLEADADCRRDDAMYGTNAAGCPHHRHAQGDQLLITVSPSPSPSPPTLTLTLTFTITLAHPPSLRWMKMRMWTI